ncbi:MAG: hypothetical protein WC975_14035 [Phycisphaerae bacterium]
MTKDVMNRNAKDNDYLHKDFHGALSAGLIYLEERFGANAVREYLWQFAKAYYAPLTDDVNRRGLVALRDHFQKIYTLEQAIFTLALSENELILNLEACPAVMHIQAKGYPLSPRFYETCKTVNQALCDETPFAFELVTYEPATGQSIQKFYRRSPKP